MASLRLEGLELAKEQTSLTKRFQVLMRLDSLRQEKPSNRGFKLTFLFVSNKTDAPHPICCLSPKRRQRRDY